MKFVLGTGDLVAIDRPTATIPAMQISAGSPIRLSVSIVLHNSSLGLLKRALDSLELAARSAQNAAVLDAWELVLVDNASLPSYRDELAEMLETRRRAGAYVPQTQLQPENHGFGAGHNSALLHAESDYHLILNPDVELEPDALRVGVAHLASATDLAAVSPMVRNGAGRREYLCKNYPSVMLLAVRGFAPNTVQLWFKKQLAAYEMRDACAGNTEVAVPIVSGCFMLARTSLLRSLGGFNEDFFLYFEDFDLSLRLGEHGKLVFLPAMRIVHHGGYAASKGLRHIAWFLRSGFRFFSLHGWRWW